MLSIIRLSPPAPSTHTHTVYFLIFSFLTTQCFYIDFTSSLSALYQQCNHTLSNSFLLKHTHHILWALLPQQILLIVVMWTGGRSGARGIMGYGVFKAARYSLKSGALLWKRRSVRVNEGRVRNQRYNSHGSTSLRDTESLEVCSKWLTWMRKYTSGIVCDVTAPATKRAR